MVRDSSWRSATINKGGYTSKRRHIFKNEDVQRGVRLVRHHRRPKRYSGGENKENISFVLPSHHDAWHRLFKTLPVVEIVRLLQEYYTLFGPIQIETWEEHQRVSSLFYKIKSRRKMSRAYRVLFGNSEITTIVRIINEIWIDPEYKIVVHSSLTFRLA